MIKIIDKKIKAYEGQPIILSGPPGAGKTTIGKILADRLHIDFYNLDDMVAEQLGLQSSKEVIQKFGREYFENKENLGLHSLLENNEHTCVIAIGGGTNSRDESEYSKNNQLLINKSCYNICLLPSENVGEAVAILLGRLDNTKRAVQIDQKKLYEGYQIYTPIFIREADVVVYTYTASVDAIVDEILKMFIL